MILNGFELKLMLFFMILFLILPIEYILLDLDIYAMLF